MAQLGAREAALERKKAKSELRLELLHIIRELMERNGGECTVGEVQQEALSIWQQRHPGVPLPM
jgi:hypothetical protein